MSRINGLPLQFIIFSLLKFGLFISRETGSIINKCEVISTAPEDTVVVQTGLFF